MAKISDSERAAVNETDPLVLFAAERVKELDPDLPLAIAQRAAGVCNRPGVAQNFAALLERKRQALRPDPGSDDGHA